MKQYRGFRITYSKKPNSLGFRYYTAKKGKVAIYSCLRSDLERAVDRFLAPKVNLSPEDMVDRLAKR